MKIWQRYLFKRLCASFSFLLLSLFVLYLLIHFSEQGVKLFHTEQIGGKQIVRFYLAHFLVLLDFFVPLSFLIASLKLLLDLNSHQELAALQMAGLSKKKLLTPLFLLASFLTFFSFVNTEWIAPHSHEIVDSFWNAYSKKKIKKEHLQTFPLEDHSELIYQKYDHEKLYDVIWIRSKTEIWRIKYLHFKTKKAKEAHHLISVDHLWQNKESFSERFMEEMPLSSFSRQRFIPFESRSISSLFQQIWTPLPDQAMAQAHFFYKTSRPFLPLILLIAIAPVTMQFTRSRSYFLVIVCALASFFGFMTIVDGMLLIGETKLMPPIFALLFPFALILAITFRSFKRLC